MKLIHLSDLHLGKRVNDFPMLEDQAYILDRILEIIDREQPDAALIAGDVYDKTIPSAEAVTLLDDFLVKLADRCVGCHNPKGGHRSSGSGRLRRRAAAAGEQAPRLDHTHIRMRAAIFRCSVRFPKWT